MSRRGSKWWAYEIAKAKFGDRAMIRDNGTRYPNGMKRPTSDAERDVHRAEYKRLVENEPKMTDLKDWPADARLGDYRDALIAFRKARVEWSRARDIARSLSMGRRFTVGETHGNGINSIRGEGDTWEEALKRAGCDV